MPAEVSATKKTSDTINTTPCWRKFISAMSLSYCDGPLQFYSKNVKKNPYYIQTQNSIKVFYFEKVRKNFQQGCNGGWGYIESFAQSNNLTIIDDQGELYQYDTSLLAEPCDELEKIQLSKD